jgi:hypothetical protein
MNIIKNNADRLKVANYILNIRKNVYEKNN